ncbi:MAG: 2Fe-2S iron-sulfur cluster-binding protein [Woeseiaceae bacterium]
MKQFHRLRVARVERETSDSVRIALEVPGDLREQYGFQAGQHIPVQTTLDGRLTRRTYSICSAPGQWPLEIGVRVQPHGRFSGFAGGRLAAGDELEVMPPFGQFHATVEPDRARTLIAFAAGSGITPILSILRATLEQERGSRCALFYGNRRQRSAMFIDDLHALKNRFPERLQLYFLFSREEQEFPVFGGRLDEEKTRELYRTFCVGLSPDDVFVCGPDTMIDSVRNALLSLGVTADTVHVERFGAPRRQATTAPDARRAADAEITVVMDGHRKSFGMSAEDDNIVDAAAAQGIELPYSCKGGVCATCRTWVAEGEVRMASNYGLEPWEVEQGFALACQSRPVSRTVVLDYDKT